MQGQTNKKIIAKKLQRKLRNSATDAERQLWPYLRGRQMEGSKFRRQHPFSDYILDFVCLERKLVTELDGGQHADNVQYDHSRTQRLKQSGLRVIRFWNNEVFDNIEGVIEVIQNMLSLKAAPSPPNPVSSTGQAPPLEGEG